MTIILNALIVEDNEDTLMELKATLPSILDEYEILWTSCKSFDEATELLITQRFDIVATDIYLDSEGHTKSYDFKETGAHDTISSIRQHRFCPILAITDGSKPDHFPESPFIGFADKTDLNEIAEALKTLIATGIPKLSKILHDDLDKDASFYLWHFLENYWDHIPNTDSLLLERMLKRRAAIVLSRLDNSNHAEIETVEGLEYYIYPSISGNEYRLGEIIRNKASGEFCVVLTPHCHLAVQPNAREPRADHVLTVRTINAKQTIKNKHKVKNLGSKTPDEIEDSIRKRIQGPAGVGIPAGRYWFLPAFVDIPDLYCDFLQIESIEYSSLEGNYDRIAVLDTPFAESLQISFTGFYSAIGTPNLDPSRYNHLITD